MIDFNINIEDIKNELEGLSYVEKLKAIERSVQELKKLNGMIDDAIDELINIRITESVKHSRDVRKDVFQHIRMMIENGQLPQDKINFDDDKETIIVSSIDGNVRVYLSFGHNRLCQISIVPDFYARPKENQLWRTNLAEKLNRPLEFGNRDIKLTVEEEILKDCVFEVIVKLCDENTAKN